MKKIFFTVLFFVVVLFFGIRIYADSATKCANGFEPVTHKINDTTNEKLCYNKQTGLSYNIKKDAITNQKKYNFFKDWWYCGTNCNFDGTNCNKDGLCSETNCNQKEGYTQLKYIKGKGQSCYNPNTKMAYYGKTYFLNDKKCGYDCNYDGKNCKKGACFSEYCNAQKGYTQIKELEKSYGCYNPDTRISYDADKIFYLDSEKCGVGCDFDGKNCNNGESCVITDICNAAKGYTQIKSGRCYNPQTQISYEDKRFYVNDFICGYNCDVNGKNCKLGACFADECMRKYGYPEIKYGKCYNPKTFLTREINIIGDQNNTFYYKSKKCGIKCDDDGRNCKFISSANTIGGHIVKGICNAEDCPKGYKQLVVPEGTDYGMCKKENGGAIVFSDENNNFHNFRAGMTKDYVTAPAGIIKWFYDCSKYGEC